MLALALPLGGGQVVVQPSAVGQIAGKDISPSRVLTDDGTAAAPARSYTSDTDLGWYVASAGENWTSGSSGIRFRLSAEGAIIGASEYLQWGSSNISSPDTRLQRAAAKALTLGPTTGVTLRWATDGLLEVRNFANGAAGDLSAAGITGTTYTVGAAAGCSGTPTVVTNGIATTCAEPTVWLDMQAELLALRSELAALRAELSTVKTAR